MLQFKDLTSDTPCQEQPQWLWRGMVGGWCMCETVRSWTGAVSSRSGLRGKDRHAPGVGRAIILLSFSVLVGWLRLHAERPSSPGRPWSVGYFCPFTPGAATAGAFCRLPP